MSHLLVIVSGCRGLGWFKGVGCSSLSVIRDQGLGLGVVIGFRVLAGFGGLGFQGFGHVLCYRT